MKRFLALSAAVCLTAVFASCAASEQPVPAQADIDAALLSLSSDIMNDMGFDPSSYDVVAVTNVSSYALVDHYFSVERGKGSTHPIIYADEEQRKYWIVYQQGDGMNVIEEVTLKGDGDEEEAVVQRHEAQGEVVDLLN